MHRRPRPFLVASALALGLAAGPAAAFDPANMSEAERGALRAEIRAYLLENPQVIYEAAAIFEEQQAALQAEADVARARANADDLFNDPTAWVGGNPDGDVTMVEFLDYRCGFCRRAHHEIEALLAEDGNLRFIIKEFPVLGDQSVLASRFALATRAVAGDAAYKQVHDALIALDGPLSPPRLAEVAQALSLDGVEIMARMDGDDITAILRENEMLAQRLQINGTPSFVIGDQMVRGFRPMEEMQEIVEAVRAE